jgi:hypothetical protein
MIKSSLILCTVLFECILLSGVCFLPDSKFVLRIDVLLLREPKKYKFIQALPELGDLTAMGSL